MGDLWAFGKKLVGKVVDGYNKPASLDPPIENLNDVATFKPTVSGDLDGILIPIHLVNHLQASIPSRATIFNDPLGIGELPIRPSTGPTLLDMGDHWVKNSDMNGLLTWGTLLARKWTGYRPKAAKAQSYDPSIDIQSSIRSHELVDAFMDKVKEQTETCGVEKAVSDAMDNPNLYTQAIETVHKKLAKEELETIAEHLFEQVVQKNISKIASTSTPDQANQLLAKVSVVITQTGKHTRVDCTACMHPNDKP